jgi:sortase A
MRNDSRETSVSRIAWLLLCAERLLLIAGAAMLAWWAMLVVDGMIAQRSARSAFEAALLTKEVALPPVEEVTVLAPRVRAIDQGSPIAALSIPRIRLSAMVLQGSDGRTLRRGPGHVENTAFPGEPGNMVIAGHRDSFFRSLQNINLGDDIFLDTREGPLQYRVTSVRVVDPGDVSVIARTDETVLTLITCYPFWLLGPAPDRFIVRAILVNEPSAASVETGARAQAPLEAARAPVLDAVAADKSVSTEVDRVTDDESLVRQAVGRYLSIQGVRLVTRSDIRLGRTPAFICDLSFGDDRAIADCNAVSPLSSEQELHGRIFTLAHSSDAWAIRSIELK